MYLPAPVVLPAASTIAIGLPITEKSFIAHFASTSSCFSSFLLRIDRRANRLVHLRISGAAAEIAAERFANFVFGGLGIVGQQPAHGHHESRSAESALRAAEIAISLLQCRQPAVVGDAFDGGDLLPLATGRQHGAREHGHAVDLHRAGAAGGVVASPLGAGQIEVLAQDVEQQLVRLDGQLVSASVNAKFNEFFFHRKPVLSS